MSRLSSFLSSSTVRNAASMTLRAGTRAAVSQSRAAMIPAFMRIQAASAAGSPQFSAPLSMPTSFAASGLSTSSTVNTGVASSSSTGEVADSAGEGTAVAGSSSASESNPLCKPRRKRKL
eukprot:CAMPEP_0202902090 /NCGR_PEP_ID=MMETSP1392-20130828/16295_1 /ASSEMBLY_ACC=CAM_ASM_000868 /TAXON_ID=225041 /ORGANISM="Chlamydomonas chlamydogama, Strain SAG 11-48b" /LENGTH=119 /DNA_ID=CAMNT_0049588793 /DNA_START=120 /DNA_END=479 /DNA_ORIENTATION=-